MITVLHTAAVTILLLGGLFFTFVAAVGLIRLSDVYMRSHLASETDTLGAGMALAAVALTLGWQSQTVQVLLLLTFIFISNPTAAHAITRAALEDGVEPLLAASSETDQTITDTGEGATHGG